MTEKINNVRRDSEDITQPIGQQPAEQPPAGGFFPLGWISVMGAAVVIGFVLYMTLVRGW